MDLNNQGMNYPGVYNSPMYYDVGPNEMIVIHIPKDTIGLLIGKDGKTIKQLQQRTGARIQVTRDADSHPDALTRPVTLTGPRYLLQIAQQEIHNLIATQSSHGLETMFGDLVQLELLIPNQSVGLLIGKAGQTIKDLQIRTGAKIQVTRDSDQEDTSSTSRSVLIIGPLPNVELARHCVEQLLSSFPVSPLVAAEEFAEVVEEVLIPVDLVGLLIGKSGSTIRALQDQYRCRIQIARVPENEVEQGQRRVVLSGSAEGVAMAREGILELLGTERNGSLVGDGCSKVLEIPESCVGLIIGKGGDMIRSLQSRSGAALEISREPLRSGFKSLSISGSDSSVSAAQALVEELVSPSGGSLRAIN